MHNTNTGWKQIYSNLKKKICLKKRKYDNIGKINFVLGTDKPNILG